MTLTAFESTLRLYHDESRAVEAIPTLRMLTEPLAVTTARAERLAARLEKLADRGFEITSAETVARAGGGALPLLEIPSRCLRVRCDNRTAKEIESFMRGRQPPIIGRIENDRFVLDLRTVAEDELSDIETAFRNLLGKELQ